MCTQVLYLDVVTATARRADSHADGLHYCLPGPPDTWVTLLFNALVLIDDAPGCAAR